MIGVCSIRDEKERPALASDRCSLVLTFHASNWCLPIVIVTNGERGRQRERKTREEEEDAMDDGVEGKGEREKKKLATLEGTICTTRDNHPMLLTAGLTGAATDDDDEFRGKTYRSMACAVRCLQVDTHGQRCESRRSVV